MKRCCWIVLAVCGLTVIVVSQRPDVEFVINEELAVSTHVGNLQEIEHLFPDLSERERHSLQYGILDQGDVPSSLFNITRLGGVLSVARRVDRESICFAVESCIMKVNILASAHNSSQFDSRVITVHFKIVDINDNSPTFDQGSIVLEVPEGSPQDTVLKISGANDRDYAAEYKVKNYTLSASHDVFTLSTYQTLDGSSEIHLKLRKTLDRETQDKYEMTITAYDGGSTARSSTLFVTVDVTDQNDNAPQFVNNTYNVTIDSNTLLNQVFLQVSAMDADKGDNALLTYDFTNFHKPVLEKVFHINSTTGEISMVRPLTPGKQEFIVEAQDSGNPKLKTQTVVYVNVVSTGNAPPKISIATLGSNFDQNVVSVLEPGGRGFFVAFVVVDDESTDDVLCQIQSNVFMLVPVANKGYKIVLQGSVDREEIAVYNLTVICEDKGDPPLNNTLQFRVNIEDANDNAPVFSQQRYSRTMSEGKKNGEYVLQVSASDQDTGLNGLVRYSLDSNYTQYFRIDQVTGVLSAMGDLDREAHPVMTFNIYATDQGKLQPKQSWAEVVIVLEDINDNIPEFEKKVIVLQVMEDVQEKSVIANLVANDADAGINSQLQYFFTGSSDGADRVLAVLANGSVVTSTKLDREKKANYSFSVMVRDNGNPSLMSRASVLMEVLDVNDNSPVILFPKSQNYTVLISNIPETGVVLSRIIAYDDDADDNGSLQYTLVSGNDDAAFEISEAGELKIALGSRLKNNKKYDIGILVSDEGLPPKFATASIKIDVLFNNITHELVKQGQESQDDYIIIVAVIAAVTVVFSTLIVVAICVIFQKDKGKGAKQVPKHVVNSIGIHGNLSSIEKISRIYSENTGTALAQTYTSNGLSPTTNEKDNISNSLLCNQVKEDNTDSPKGKSVSFIFNQSNMVSPEPHYIIGRNGLLQSLSECGDISMVNSSDENASLRRSSLPEQGDDITSDTSADTSTGDSGRGNSVDDVNFDQIIKGDLSCKMFPRKTSDAMKCHNYKSSGLDNSRVSYQQVPYSYVPDRRVPPELMQKNKPTNRYPNERHSSERKPHQNGVQNMSANSRFHAQVKGHSSRPGTVNSLGLHRQLSVTSADDDATTTTSGSYVVNPEEIRIDTFVGADIIV